MTNPEPAMNFESHLTLREARERFFARNGFKESQYDEPIVMVMAGPVPVPLPNTKGRKRAVRVHDLHHILTEYETSMTGEAEIGTWELATGCKDYYAAWVLNGLAMLMGFVIAPRRTLRAFARGRRSRNLYGREVTEPLLAERIEDLRRSLGLQRGP